MKTKQEPLIRAFSAQTSSAQLMETSTSVAGRGLRGAGSQIRRPICFNEIYNRLSIQRVVHIRRNPDISSRHTRFQLSVWPTSIPHNHPSSPLNREPVRRIPLPRQSCSTDGSLFAQVLIRAGALMLFHDFPSCLIAFFVNSQSLADRRCR